MQMTSLGKLKQSLLIFGGPYSNLAATRAMRRRAEELRLPAERIICTGDLVAYCAEPAETLDLIRDWGIHVVMGNCEESLGFGQADCGCGFEADSSCSTLAIAWYEYANRRVTDSQRSWMRELPRGIDFALGETRFRVVHASLSSINEFVFASSDAPSKLRQIRQAGVDAVIGGHSGIPFGQSLEAGLWLNAGVIGMPANDGGAHGWYMTIEPGDDGFTASWHRLDYEHDISRRSTIAAGMAEYGRALGDGLWPNMDILPAPEREQRGRPLDLPAMRI